jgi:Zn-finger protein
MKRKILAAIFLASFTAGAAIAGMTPGSGIVGSAHDMNTITGLTPDAQGRVCAFCHTPHHAMPDPSTNDQQPLWSHEYTGYIVNWIPYQSPTLQANIIDPLKGPSRLCMSCHDGVVAADQHYGSVGGNSNARLQSDDWSGAAVGKATSGSADFSNDHPIGFNYNDAQAADVGGGLFPSLGRNFIGNTNNPTLTVKDVLLDGDFMTCATCHDVHNKDNANNTKGGLNYFVYADQDGSKLCLTCHAKGSESP